LRGMCCASGSDGMSGTGILHKLYQGRNATNLNRCPSPARAALDKSRGLVYNSLCYYKKYSIT